MGGMIGSSSASIASLSGSLSPSCHAGTIRMELFVMVVVLYKVGGACSFGVGGHQPELARAGEALLKHLQIHWVLVVHVVYSTDGDNLPPASRFAAVWQIGADEYAILIRKCFTHACDDRNAKPIELVLGAKLFD